MKRFAPLALVLLVLPAGPLAASANDERLVSPALPGFAVGHSQANANGMIREEIPKGETVHNWKRMVTTQRFTGLAAKVTPAKYAASILDGLSRACPKASVSPVQPLVVSGHRAINLRVICPGTANVKPESFFLLAIAGKKDMHVKQVAFRGEATAEDFLWARKFLDGVILCSPKNKAAA
jgi:hypothetical protein